MSALAAELTWIELGDRRLNRRARRLLEKLGEKPTVSIPAACGGWGETRAAYRLFDHPEVTAEAVLLRCAPTDTIRCKIPGMKAPGQDEIPCSVPSAPYSKWERNTVARSERASKREKMIASEPDRGIFYAHELALWQTSPTG